MKIFNQLRAFLMLFLLLSIAYACRNQVENEVSDAVAVEKTASTNPKWLGYVIKNVANAQDSIGYFHNQGLDFVIKSLNTNDVTNSIRSNTIAYTCTARNVSNCSQVSDLAISKIFAVADFNTYEPNLSNVAKGFYRDLRTLILTYQDSTDISLLQHRIISWENQVNQSLIQTSEKNVLLIAGSVARYSSAYWFYHYQLDDQSIWFIKSNNNKLGKFWKTLLQVLAIAGADVVGGLEGAGGGPVGAIAGAIGGSAAAALGVL